MSRFTPASWAIAFANVAVFALQVRAGLFSSTATASGEDLLRWGAAYGPAIFVDGEVWRLLTSAFVHVAVWHLALNLWGLWDLGPACERRLGTATFLPLYGIAAVGGALVSVAASPAGAGAGASGALFGLMGVELAALLRRADPLSEEERRKRLWRLASYVVGGGLLLAAISPGSNAAHFGGLVVGSLFGLWVLRGAEAPPRGVGARMVALGALAGLLVLVGVGVSASVRADPWVRAREARASAHNALQVGQPAQALAFANEGVDAGVDLGNAYWMRAHVHEALGQTREAIADYGAMLSAGGDATIARSRRCYLRSYEEAPAEVVPECEAAALTAAGKADPAVHIGLARVLLQVHRTEEALGAAERALLLAPGNPEALIQRGWAQLALGRPEPSIAAFTEAARGASGVLEREARRGQAAVAAQVGDFPRARQLLDGLLRDEPGDVSVLITRAQLLHGLQEHDAAIADLDQAVALAPDWVPTHNNRAWYLLAAGRAADALIAADRAVALAPGLAYARGTRCWVREALGDRVGALEDCRAAVSDAAALTADSGMLALLEGAPLAKVEAAWTAEAERTPADKPFLARTLARVRTQGTHGSANRQAETRP
ncbi:rhomboid family intramembrane serine protease [Pyxidicoccus sp. MSG2]|uniref:rhomboid family intramembrane serine protease n=1 Tax=Pyxidicoccus sp. MSG2 TaxID=2996790 RepID=UPI00226F3810|nr:rhomboid family intramembrane serine protease [Pyxidicoccus sp. MSG2]MCY1015782.1 rhomboid family intramembrane serine protease [Pyxidicoccus sp. MSG2]